MEKNGKKYFTQKELEKHINKRLIRERKKYDRLEMLRRMMDELIASGAIDADSWAEAAERLGEILGSGAVGTMRTSEGEQNAKDTSVKTDIGDPSEDNTEAEEVRGKTEDVQHGDDGETTDDLSVDYEDFPMDTVSDEDVEADSDTPEPETHTEEKDSTEKTDISGTLAQICSSLLELIDSEKQRRASEDSIKSARRDLCSTGFSKGSAADIHSEADGLTPMQRELAKRAGLSYREYAKLLSEIPKNTRKRKNREQAL